MADEKIIQVVRGLLKQTMAGKVAWESTDKEGVFQVAYTNYSIRISIKETDMGEDVWITVINDFGDVVESVSDVTLSGNLTNAYSVMSKIYAEARRIAMGVNAALDEILMVLGVDDDEEDVPF